MVFIVRTENVFNLKSVIRFFVWRRWAAVKSQDAEYHVNMTCFASILRHVFRGFLGNQRMFLLYVSIRYKDRKGLQKKVLILVTEGLWNWTCWDRPPGRSYEKKRPVREEPFVLLWVFLY